MKVTLKKPHTHAGKSYPKDAQIDDVSITDARWMQAHGVIDEPSLRDAATKPAAGDKPAPAAQ